MPADLTDLSRQAATGQGQNPKILLITLAGTPEAAQDALAELATSIRQQAAQPVIRPHSLAMWDTVISALLAAAAGDARAAAAVDERLAELKNSKGWKTVAAVLQRIRAGKTGLELLTGLSETDAVIVTRALDAYRGKVEIPPALWIAMPFGGLLSDLVAGAHGDEIARTNARTILEAITRHHPDFAPLTTVLGQILDNGERDPRLISTLDDPAYRAIVATVLHHIRT
jgi:hypothetical protein